MELGIRGLCPLLQVFDMPRSIAFYRDILGFEVVRQVPEGDRCDWALLRLHGAELMLNTAYEHHERPPAPDPARVGAHRDTALFLGCADVYAACARLRATGMDVDDPVVRDYGMIQLSLSDPDGYGICLQHPVGQTAGTATRRA